MELQIAQDVFNPPDKTMEVKGGKDAPRPNAPNVLDMFADC